MQPGGTSSAHRSSSKRLLVILALALNAVVIAAIWLLSARDPAPPIEAAVADEPTAPPAPVLARDVQRPAPPTPAARAHVAADGIGFMPAHDGDPRPEGALHPHPISAQHQRIFAENRIAFALDDATDAKDVSVMKELLARYRREFPEDQWQLQSGYAVIIDCLEHPGPDSRGNARRWLDQNNGSTVKRSVLRNCIDLPQP
jgi:hypothetical protein